MQKAASISFPLSKQLSFFIHQIINSKIPVRQQASPAYWSFRNFSFKKNRLYSENSTVTVISMMGVNRCTRLD